MAHPVWTVPGGSQWTGTQGARRETCDMTHSTGKYVSLRCRFCLDLSERMELEAACGTDCVCKEAEKRPCRTCPVSPPSLWKTRVDPKGSVNSGQLYLSGTVYQPS